MLKKLFAPVAVLLGLLALGLFTDTSDAGDRALAHQSGMPHSAAKRADIAILLKDLRVEALELSPDANWLAAVVVDRATNTWVKVWCLPSGRETLDTLHAGVQQSARELAWHPWKPLLAVDGGGYGDARSGGWVGGLFVLDVFNGKFRDVWYPGLPESCCAWMPDGLHIITGDPLLVDVRNGKAVGMAHTLWPGDMSKTTTKLSVSLRGDIARASVASPAEEGSAKLEMYRRTGKGYKSFKKVSEFRFVWEQPPGGLVIPIEPSFLADGRIAFLRWCRLSLEKKEAHRPWEGQDEVETADVQVWVADRNGKNAAAWITLPQARTWANPRDTSETLFAISRDGRTIAYMRDYVLHVRQVDPPSHTAVPGQRRMLRKKEP